MTSSNGSGVLVCSASTTFLITFYVHVTSNELDALPLRGV